MNFNKQTFVNTSNQVSPWVILLIIVVGCFFSAVIPPFQSPDEFAHVERAYLLSKGTIILDHKNEVSGGMIDSGLMAYMEVYRVLPNAPNRKLSADELDFANDIQWMGSKEFSNSPGTGYYFPLAYLPQAMGLTIGEMLGLSIDSSYRMARFMALASLALLLFAAFKTYYINPLTIALLIVPMTVFQFSSASLDGISTALAIFSIALFFRITHEKENASPWLFYSLTLSVVLVATCRTHLLVLLALILCAGFYTKNRKHFYVFVFALLFVLGWTVIAVKTTLGVHRGSGSTPSIALFYIKHPLAFFNVLVATLSASATFYRYSFLGFLGWFEVRFSEIIYEYLSILVFLIGVLSVSVKNLKTEWIPRLIVLFSAFVSILLIFFALLITWTPHLDSLIEGVPLIEGVQGRYFLVPLIMIAYALSGELKLYEGTARKIALLLLILLGAFTIFCTPKLLLERYYLATEQPEPISIEMRPSIALEKNNSIKLLMNKTHEKKPQSLKRVGILFGTYVRKNLGSAELKLTTLAGQTLTIPFNLPDLADNEYKYFDLDSMPYSSGQITYLTGGGISTWEAHRETGSFETCLVLEYTNGAKRYTRGCLHP